MSRPKVVSVSLVKNEDLWIRHALISAAPICDEFLILDNMSDDSTKLEVDSAMDYLGIDNDQYRYIQVKDPTDTNQYLQEYCGTNTWIFGVDGDEVYDPKGLDLLRKTIDSNLLNDYHRIQGHAINVCKIDGPFLQGYLAPPARTITKLYNFNHYEHLPRGERLHGEMKRYPNKELILDLFARTTFDDSIFRCAHMCFIKRSTRDTHVPRSAPPGHGGPQYKVQNYQKGELASAYISDFFECNIE
jgi:hypothetical protein